MREGSGGGEIIKKAILMMAAVALLAAGCAGDESGTTKASAATVTTTEARDVELGVSDFGVELITIESRCFGSAGALVTVEPELYSSKRALAMTGEVDQTYRVTYEVGPVEGGTNTYSLEFVTFTGQYRYDPEHRLSTDSCSHTPKATVTMVRKIG